jgi:hypothetical protein
LVFLFIKNRRPSAALGVFFSTPSANVKDGIHDMRYGVKVARKGGLTAEGCFNAKGVDGLWTG